jgi:hypothetical protein
LIVISRFSAGKRAVVIWLHVERICLDKRRTIKREPGSPKYGHPGVIYPCTVNIGRPEDSVDNYLPPPVAFVERSPLGLEPFTPSGVPKEELFSGAVAGTAFLERSPLGLEPFTPSGVPKEEPPSWVGVAVTPLLVRSPLGLEPFTPSGTPEVCEKPGVIKPRAKIPTKVMTAKNFIVFDMALSSFLAC